MGESQHATVILMTRPAVAGRVKTRLIGKLSAQEAAQVHQAMALCMQQRLSCAYGENCRWVLAVDGGARAWEAWEQRPQLAGWDVIDQGTGDLGDRLKDVWEQIGAKQALFFGVDCPDIPFKSLQAVKTLLLDHDAVVGPVDDGGYWTLAANYLQNALLEGIDWGTSSVYHQTLAAAAEADLSLASADPWFDVDYVADLGALRGRLVSVTDPDLVELRGRLDDICKE